MQAAVAFDDHFTPGAELDLLAARHAVDSVDFAMVKRKLMDPDEGVGWTKEEADAYERQYRNFLCLVRMYPGHSIVPTKNVDLFWHQHILDTRAYAKDCVRVFGEFLHHFPYFGMRGKDDERDLEKSFELSRKLYAETFGEPYCGETVLGGRCVKCGSGPVKCHHQPTRCR